MTRRNLTKAEMLAEIRKTPRWWRANGTRLMAEHRFPRPLAGLGQVWDSAAIDAWRDAQLTGNGVAVGGAADPTPITIGNIDERLEHNIRAIVAGVRH